MSVNEVIIIKQEKIYRLKDKLRATDYQALKFAEGELTEEEFYPTREQRKAWRAEINQIEAEIDLIVDWILHMTGEENLNPLEDE